MSEDRLPLAIVIPVHNGVRYTVRCLAALRATPGPSRVIIVVDDGSSDGTAAVLAEEFPEVVVVPGTGRLWWSGSADLGCRVALSLRAQRILLLNNDNVEMSSNLLTTLDELLNVRGGCVSATAIARSDDGDVILHAGGDLNWKSSGIRLRDAGGPYRQRGDEVSCAWLPGTALAFDRDVFLDVGGFDPRFPQYRGDIDFTLRAREYGHACTVTYACWVVNDKSQTGLHFGRRLTVNDFVNGLVSLRSNYNVRETVRFALRHCPVQWLPYYLGQFYARYCYAFLRSRIRRPSPLAAVGPIAEASE